MYPVQTVQLLFLFTPKKKLCYFICNLFNSGSQQFLTVYKGLIDNSNNVYVIRFKMIHQQTTSSEHKDISY